MGEKPTKTLIIEFGFHILQVDNLAFLLGGLGSVTLVCRTRLMNQSRQENFFACSSETTFLFDCETKKYWGTAKFYLRIIREIPSSRYVWIATGPEHSNPFDLLFLTLIYVLARSKVVLNIRDVSKWIPRKNGPITARLIHMLRHVLQRATLRVTFESSKQESFFAPRFAHRNTMTASLPTQIADFKSEFFPIAMSLTQRSDAERIVRVGVLGSIDPSRKNYTLLKESISHLQPELRKRLVLFFLGGVETSAGRKELLEFQELVPIRFSDSFLSTREFYSLGAECDFLVAPLREEKDYGAVKGSGAFGDAVGLGKKLLVPERSVPGEEYSQILVAYTDRQSLTEALDQLIRQSLDDQLETLNLEAFSRAQVVQTVAQRLGLF